MAGIIVLAIIFNTCKKNNLNSSVKKSTELRVGKSLNQKTPIVISENTNHQATYSDFNSINEINFSEGFIKQ